MRPAEQRRQVVEDAQKVAGDDADARFACSMLLASVIVGPGREDVARFLRIRGARRPFFDVIADGFERNHIWYRGKVRHSGWDHPEDGGLALLMDAACGLGLLERVGNDRQGR